MHAHAYLRCARLLSREIVVDGYVALFDLIGVLARRRYQEAVKEFAALGLTHTEARLLTLLSAVNGAAAQETLTGGLVVDRTNAGRALQRLERDGLVVRAKDTADKRAKVVRMTDAGRHAAARITAMKPHMARAFFRDLEESDAGAAVALLQKALTCEEIEKQSPAPHRTVVPPT